MSPIQRPVKLQKFLNCIKKLFKSKNFTSILKLLKSFNVFFLSDNLLYNYILTFTTLFWNKAVLQLGVCKSVLPLVLEPLIWKISFQLPLNFCMNHNTSKIKTEDTVKPACPVYMNTYFKQQYKHWLNQGIKISTRHVSISCLDYSFFPPSRCATAITFLSIQIVVFWVIHYFNEGWHLRFAGTYCHYPQASTRPPTHRSMHMWQNMLPASSGLNRTTHTLEVCIFGMLFRIWSSKAWVRVVRKYLWSIARNRPTRKHR